MKLRIGWIVLALGVVFNIMLLMSYDRRSERERVLNQNNLLVFNAARGYFVRTGKIPTDVRQIFTSKAYAEGLYDPRLKGNLIPTMFGLDHATWKPGQTWIELLKVDTAETRGSDTPSIVPDSTVIGFMVVTWLEDPKLGTSANHVVRVYTLSSRFNEYLALHLDATREHPNQNGK